MAHRNVRAILALGVAAVVATGIGGGCLSPTLPLPPPEAPLYMRSIGDGRWEIGGECSAGAVVTALVSSTGRGAVVEDRDADGTYSLVVTADRCELVDLWQTDGDETSARTRIVLYDTAEGTDESVCAR